MVVFQDKSSDSALQPVLKTVKIQYDNPRILRRYELVIRRHLFLERGYKDITWHGEAFHQLALLRENKGDIGTAEELLTEALSKLKEDQFLTRARVTRDLGLLVATHRDPVAGLLLTHQALALHDGDFKNLKGRRQRRLTESYVWRVRLLVDSEDVTARDSLIKYALSGCRDCCTRDQHEAIAVALLYADGAQKQLLDARLIQIYARRYKLSSVVMSTAKLVIDTELSLANRVLRTLLRKE